MADEIQGPPFTFHPLFASRSGPFGNSHSVTFLGKSEKNVPRVAESGGTPGTDLDITVILVGHENNVAIFKHVTLHI